MNMSDNEIKTLCIREKNRINLEIKTICKQIDSNKDTISRFNSSSNKTDFIKNKISQLKSQNLDKEKNLEKLKERLIKLDNGELLSELKQNIINTEVKSKKVVESKIRNEDKIMYNKYNDEHYKSNRQNKYLEKDYIREYNYFCKICSEIPDSINESLKSMSNGEGYIYRGVYLYGHQGFPNVQKNVVMTEIFTKNGEAIPIKYHEWNEDEYIIYKKYRNTKNILSRTQRNKIK
jgi:hypothetical protein